MPDEFEGKHELVKLLVTRIRAHPDEFRSHTHVSLDDSNRWGYLLRRARDILAREDWAIVENELRPIQLDALRDEFLDELMNGDDRRAMLNERERMSKAQAMQAAQLNQSKAQTMQAAQLNQIGAVPGFLGGLMKGK